MTDLDTAIDTIVRTINQEESLGVTEWENALLSGRDILNLLKDVDGFPESHINNNGDTYINNGQGESLVATTRVESDIWDERDITEYSVVGWDWVVYREDDHITPIGSGSGIINDDDTVRSMLEIIVNWVRGEVSLSYDGSTGSDLNTITEDSDNGTEAETFIEPTGSEVLAHELYNQSYANGNGQGSSLNAEHVFNSVQERFGVTGEYSVADDGTVAVTNTSGNWIEFSLGEYTLTWMHKDSEGDILSSHSVPFYTQEDILLLIDQILSVLSADQ